MAFYFTLILLSWVDSLILLPLSSTEPITYKWCHLVFGVHVRHQRGQHSQLTLSADWTNFIKAHICVYIRTVSVCRCSQHLADCRWILCNFFSFCQVLKLWRHPPENSETNRNVKETLSWDALTWGQQREGKKTNSICSCVCGEHDFYFFLPFQVFIKTGYNRKQRPSLFLWLHAWETESFAWICTAETGRSWEQTNKTHCKLTRILPSSVNRLMNEEEEEGGGDQQYLKCTNCSRSVCTTCTVSTLELQCRHVQPESHKVMSH